MNWARLGTIGHGIGELTTIMWLHRDVERVAVCTYKVGEERGGT